MYRKTPLAEREYYHIYSRGVEKRKVFMNSKDYQRFMALLYIMNQNEPFKMENFLRDKQNNLKNIFNQKREKTFVSILAYCLMPNHFHLILYEHTEGGISKFMMKLLTAYSMYFNTKYERSGPLFMHPFRSQHISSESQFLWIFSYIHLNPLKVLKGKNTPTHLLQSYKYSSYPDYEGVKRVESKILDLSLTPDFLLETDLNIKIYEKWLKKYQGLPLISLK